MKSLDYKTKIQVLDCVECQFEDKLTLKMNTYFEVVFKSQITGAKAVIGTSGAMLQAGNIEGILRITGTPKAELKFKILQNVIDNKELTKK